jgi:hypothetical protein
MAFPFHEYECAGEFDLGKEGGDDLLSDMSDVIQAAIPELPVNAMDEADRRIDQIVRMWHQETNGTRDSLDQLVRKLQESQLTVMEAVVAAELVKE